MQNAAALLQAGIVAAKAGKDAEAKALLVQVVTCDPRNESAWLWLSRVLPTVEQSLKCLDHLLSFNPQNDEAREAKEVLELQELVRDVSRFPTATAHGSAAPAAPTKRLGNVLVELGVITPEELQIALAEQARAASTGYRIRIGELLLRGHGLRREQLARALRAQIEAEQAPRKERRLPSIGHYLVHEGALTADQLADALAIQSGHRHGPRPQIGALLIELGYVTPEQLQHALSSQYHQYNDAFM